MTEEKLVIMVKDPSSGRVKTRLAAALGDELAETLYRSFVADILDGLRDIPFDQSVAYHPPGAQESVEEWLGKDIPLMAQEGRDLGERMKSLFLRLFREGYSRVVLVGSDIPDLTASLVEQAFDALRQNEGVIGPAMDGGYYLIGFTEKGFFPDLFEGMEWGTSRVYTETMRIFSEKGRTVHVLPEWSDVDTLDDLKALYSRHEHTGFRHSRTMACIEAQKERILP